MVGMSETTNSPTPIEVPVRTKGWQSMVMVVCAGFMCLAQTAFAAQRFGQDSAVYVWMVFCMLVAFAIGFLLLARSPLSACHIRRRVCGRAGFPIRSHSRFDGVDRAIGPP